MRKIFAISGFINYLLVVFLNAFTDLGHKIIIQNTIFKVYDGSEQIVLTAIVNTLILLPFLLVFSPAGFLADRFAKNDIMKYSAVFAVILTLIITYSYYNGLFTLAFFMTFLLALQSAIYSPAKYGYIKELVGDKYISAANGVIQAVTTSAILLGIIFYTIFFENMLNDDFSSKEDILKIIAPLGWLLVLGSIIEMYLAFKLANTNKIQSHEVFKIGEYFKGKYLKNNIKILRNNKDIFIAIIALSLFWSISQVILAIFGEYAKSNIGISNTIIVQGLMALSVIGIIIGSILAAKFAKYYINVGISAISAIGITIVVILIPFSTSIIILILEFILFGFFSGLIIVPLNSQIQHLSSRENLGKVIAGNNFIQTLFMVSFLLLSTIFAYFGTNAKILFYLMSLIGFYLSYILVKNYFVMAIWSFLELIFRSMYKFKYSGLENIPKDKAVLLLGNHVSWIDWFILQLPLQRRISFMIDKKIYNWKFAKPFFIKAELIPLSARAAKDSFNAASKKLKEKKIVVIFPEGEITRTKELSRFRRGYEYIDKNDAVLIPFYIDGVFGSIFSRYKGKKKRNLFKKREINVVFSKEVSQYIKADELKDVIEQLKIIKK